MGGCGDGNPVLWVGVVSGDGVVGGCGDGTPVHAILVVGVVSG